MEIWAHGKSWIGPLKISSTDLPGFETFDKYATGKSMNFAQHENTGIHSLEEPGSESPDGLG